MNAQRKKAALPRRKPEARPHVRISFPLNSISYRLLCHNAAFFVAESNAVYPDFFDPIAVQRSGIVLVLNLPDCRLAGRVQPLFVLHILDLDDKTEFSILAFNQNIAAAFARLPVARNAPICACAEQRQQKAMVKRLLRVVKADHVQHLFVQVIGNRCCVARLKSRIKRSEALCFRRGLFMRCCPKENKTGKLWNCWFVTCPP